MRKILLVRLRSIGDTVLATPVIFALKRFLPDADVDILVEDWVAPVLANHPHVNNVVALERGGCCRARAVARGITVCGLRCCLQPSRWNHCDFSDSSHGRASSSRFQDLSIRATSQSSGAIAAIALGTTEDPFRRTTTGFTWLDRRSGHGSTSDTVGRVPKLRQLINQRLLQTLALTIERSL